MRKNEILCWDCANTFRNTYFDIIIWLNHWYFVFANIPVLTYRNESASKIFRNCNKKKIESINHNKISSLKNYIFTTGAKNRSVSFSSRTFSSMYTALNQRKEKMVEICLNATRLRYVYFVPRCVRFSFVTEFNRPRPRVDNLKTTNAQTRTTNNKRGRLD